MRANKIIFFCGGKIGSENIEAVKPQSLRAYLHYKLKYDTSMSDLRFVRAEELTNWFYDAIKVGISFDNILSFETQVSYLSVITCIIVESPGAIAELGSFCVLPEFSGRIMAISRENEFSQNSFISLGPLRKISKEANDNGGVFVYDWDVNYRIHKERVLSDILPISKLEEIFVQFKEDVRLSIDQTHKSEKLVSTNMRHKYSLVVDILNVFHCLKLREIELIMSDLDVCLTSQQIKICLFLGEKLNLVFRSREGGVDYYLGTSPDELADYDFKKTSGNKFDRAVFKMSLLSAINSKEPNRKRALRKLKRQKREEEQ